MPLATVVAWRSPHPPWSHDEAPGAMRFKTALLIVIGLLALAGAAELVMSMLGADADPGKRLALGTTPPTASTTLQPIATSARSPAANPKANSQPAVSIPMPAREDVSPGSDSGFSPRRLRIRVVRAGSGTPVPGARIYCLPPSPRSSGNLGEPLLAYARRKGTEVVADRDGVATLPYADNVFRACAVTDDGWFGRVTAKSGYQRSPADGDVVLSVEPDVTLQAVVRDPLGKPVPFAGVNVTAAESDYPVASARADDQGRVQLAHLQTYIEGEQLRLQAVGFGGGGEAQLLTLNGLRQRAQPLDLRIPHWGELLVGVSPIDASRFDQDVEKIAPRIKRIDEQQQRGKRRFDPARNPCDRYDANGTARVRPVVVGGRFQIDAGFGNLNASTDGPALAGETIRVDLRPDFASLALVRASFTGPRGEPAVGMRARLRVRAGAEARKLDTFYGVVLDAEGASLRALRQRPPAGEEVFIEIEGDLDGAPMRATSKRLPYQPGGTLDFGGVQLQPRTLLVGGRVVDKNGAPLPDRVTLAAQRKRPPDDRIKSRATANYSARTKTGRS